MLLLYCDTLTVPGMTVAPAGPISRHYEYSTRYYCFFKTPFSLKVRGGGGGAREEPRLLFSCSKRSVFVLCGAFTTEAAAAVVAAARGSHAMPSRADMAATTPSPSIVHTAVVAAANGPRRMHATAAVAAAAVFAAPLPLFFCLFFCLCLRRRK